jgi:putative Mg2+ transporter-C (MgtC) family protein
LGGGVIVKHEDKIIGVTTAAFIWVIAGIGILCGLGAVLMPIVVTFGLLMASVVFEDLEKFIRR